MAEVLPDNFSSDGLPVQQGAHAAQVSNNALVALGFIVKHERDRAERILDYYAEATIADNSYATLRVFSAPEGHFRPLRPITRSFA